LKKNIHSSFYVIICFSFDVHDRIKNIFKHILLDVHNIQIMMKDISLPLRNLPKILFLPNYVPHQNQKTFTYRIENQIQCSYITILHHRILHPTILMVQLPFQLYFSRSHFYFFCIDDDIARTSDGKQKKKVLPPFIKVKASLFSIQYGHANFLYVLHPETIPYTGKSFIVHIKVFFN